MSADLDYARGQHRAGALDQAWLAYQRAAAACNGDPGYWLWLAILAWQIGHTDTAASCLQQAEQRRLSPATARWGSLGPGLAIQASELLTSLGDKISNDSLRAWLHGLEAHLPPPHRLGLWRWLLDRGLGTAAELEAAVSLDTAAAWAEGWDLLATLAMRAQHSDKAHTHWQRLIQLRPDFAPAHRNLGHLALQEARPEEAIAHYRQALSLEPLQPELHYHLGRLSLSLLEPGRAAAHFEQALAQAEQMGVSHPLWRVQQAMAYPPLSDEPPAELLARLHGAAQDLHQQVDLLACTQDLLRGGIEPCFDLSYLSEDDGRVRSAFADIFIAPQAPRWRDAFGQLRLGVLVSPGHEGLFRFGSQGLLTGLAQAGLEIVLLVLPASLPRLQDLQAAGIQLELLAHDLSAAAAQVQALELDLVYYWEAGTDPINYFLPMFQLARVQFTSWGSVSSTGLAQMQVFLSARDLESAESPGHYRERLELLPVLPMRYGPGMLSSSGKDRRALGLPEGLLIGCPHNPQKLSPAFLAALGELLAAVPAARLVLIESRHPAWQRAFANRVLSALGPLASRALWLPRLPGADFTSLIQACDLLLDPFSFGSGKLAFESLGLGIPLLTLPGRRLRGRITSACYRQIGYTPLIARDARDYVEIAARLLRDPAELAAHGAEITARHPSLMQHPDLIPAMLSTLARMAEHTRPDSIGEYA